MEGSEYYKKHKPSLEKWDEIRPELLKRLEEGGMNHKDAVSFLVAAEEIYTNTVMHGYPGGIGESAVCSVSLTWQDGEDGRCAVIGIADNGTAFDPLDVPPREPLTSLKGAAPGGFGISIARERTDRMEYRHDGDFNRLFMYRNIN